MPYIRPEEPWHPYAYVTKTGRPRLGPVYWHLPMYNGGYQYYKGQMDSWIRQLERDTPPRKYFNPNTGKTWIKKWKYNPDCPYCPKYYNYSEWLKKARKYALIRRRIYLNKQKALAKRRAMRK